ncbi:hypothetical protein Vafri_11177, partial [Volvox africanus]
MRRFLTCCLPVPFDNVRTTLDTGSEPFGDSNNQQGPLMLPRGSTLDPEAAVLPHPSRSDLLPDLIAVTAIEYPSATVPSTGPPGVNSVSHHAPPWHPSPSLSWSQPGHEQSSVFDAILEGVRGLLHSEGGVTTTFTNPRTPSDSTLLSMPRGFTSPLLSVPMTNAGSGPLDHQGCRTGDAIGGDYPGVPASGAPGLQPVYFTSVSRSSAMSVPHNPGPTAGIPVPGSTAYNTNTSSSSTRRSMGSGRYRLQTGLAATSARRRPSLRHRSNRRRTSSTSTGSSRLLGVTGLAVSTCSTASGGGRAVSVASGFREHGGGGNADVASGGRGSTASAGGGSGTPPATTSLPPSLSPQPSLSPPPSLSLPQTSSLPAAVVMTVGPLVAAPSQPRASSDVVVGQQAAGLYRGSPRSFPQSRQPPVNVAHEMTPVAAAPMDCTTAMEPSVEPPPPPSEVETVVTSGADAMGCPEGPSSPPAATATVATAAKAPGHATYRSSAPSGGMVVAARPGDLYGSMTGSAGTLHGTVSERVAVVSAREQTAHAHSQRLLLPPLLPILPIITAPKQAVTQAQQQALCHLSVLLADVANAAQPLPIVTGSGRSSIITGLWQGLPVAVKIMCSNSLAPDGPMVMAARRVGPSSHRHLVNVYGIRTAQVDQASVWTLVPEPRRSSRAFAQALAQLDRPRAALSPTGRPLRGPLPRPGTSAQSQCTLTTTTTHSVAATATANVSDPLACGTASAALPLHGGAAGATAAAGHASTGTRTSSVDATTPNGTQFHDPRGDAGRVCQLPQQAERPPFPEEEERAPAATVVIGSDGGSESAAAAVSTADPLLSPITTPAPPLGPVASVGDHRDGRIVQAAGSSPAQSLPPQLASSGALPTPQRVLMASGRETSTSPRRMALAAVRPRAGEHVVAMIMEHCEM